MPRRNRYDLPDPKCGHAHRNTKVSSHESLLDAGPNEAMASVWVCSRGDCVTDAMEWIQAKTGRMASVVTR